MELTRRNFLAATIAAGFAAAAAVAVTSPVSLARAESAASEPAPASSEAPAVGSAAGSAAGSTAGVTSPAGTVEAAAELMDALQGTYVELFPTINRYPEIWERYTAEIVGDDQAKATVEMLQGSMASEMTPEEAVEYFAAHPDEFSFNCHFPEGVAAVVIEGKTVSGLDESGATVFSGEYEYLCYNPNLDFYVFKATDPAAEYAYFIPRSDNMADTYHLEFRLGNDLNEDFEFYTGECAYRMPAAISVDATEGQIDACIKLFVTENLSE